ncbi:MAG: sulfite exporter TauE/SafE family protein [Actinobacteria bacterium]|nr:sulfite exporter TauE/SafE family protein [Actinomycetota bacterium]
MIAFAVMAAAVIVGASVQRTIGFGFALVVVPALELLRPGSVPVTVLCLAFPMTVGMAVGERAHVDARGFGWILAGRIAGTAAGLLIVTVLPADALSVALGALIVLAVLLSVAGLAVEPSPPVATGAGFLSGLMGTTSAIGGPALAVVYQRRPGPELRSTLAALFVIGTVVSFAALFAAGQVMREDVVLALELVPALLIGLAAGPAIVRRTDGRWLRPAVLAFAAAGGLAIIARGLA